MLLQDLIIGIKIIKFVGSTDGFVNAINFDSRKIGIGDVFVAIKGTLSDGHEFINRAIEQGASTIICENLPEKTASVQYIQVEDASIALATLASNFYNNPSANLKLIGITGTNGKTTIATLLYQLFKDLGYKTGLISTVENFVHNKKIASTHTTPDPLSLNALLENMVNEGCEFCFMEVSSHAIVQNRIAGLNFSGGIFSNITHDHLDFHKTFAAYITAKKAFFDGLPRSAFALTNLDDKNGMVMLQNTKAHKKTYALKQLADFNAKIIENQFTGLHLDIDNEDVFFKMVGSFNAYNLLAVYATAVLLEQDKLRVLTLLSRLTGAEGRFDYFTSPNKIVAIVDYAHTPDALQNVLSTIQNIRKGTEKIITVVGCGGDRDKTKRPIMAQVACDWSDKVILTSDNPRSEDPEAIVAEMQTGVFPSNQRKTLAVLDRKEAIRTACMLADSGDIILVAGKGHEKYQEIKGVRNHFNDKEILLEQLNLNA